MSEIDNNVSETEQMPAPVKPVRKRRPRKTADQAADQNTADAEKPVKRTRRKKTEETTGDAAAAQAAAPVKRARRKKAEDQTDTAAAESAEKPVRRTRRKKTEEQGEASDAEQKAPVKRPRRRKTAETETAAEKKPTVRRARRKKPEQSEETADQTIPAEAEKQNEAEPSGTEKETVLAFGMPEASANEEPLREITEEPAELPSRYETPEYQAFLKTQFQEETAEETAERIVAEEPVSAPAEEPAETEIIAEPEVIPFSAEETPAEDIPERSIAEVQTDSEPAAEKESTEETAAAEEIQPETEIAVEEPVPEEHPAEEAAEQVPEENKAEEIPAEEIPEHSIEEAQTDSEPAAEKESTEERAVIEETQQEEVNSAEEQAAEEYPAEADTEEAAADNSSEPAVPAEEPSEEIRTEEITEQPAAEETAGEQTPDEEPAPAEEAERSVSEENNELPSRYETPEYQAFLKEQPENADDEAPAEEVSERSLPEETSETETEQTESEELPSRYDTPEFQAFLKEQEKEEIPFAEEETPAEETGERSVPEGSEEEDPGPRKKRIAEQNRRKKKKSKKKEKYVSKRERGIIEEKPLPAQKPEEEIPEEVHEEPEVITPADTKYAEPEVIPFVNPRDREQQAEVIPFLSELTPEQPAEGDAERTRSISLSSIEAEASEPIPEPSVSFEELKYKRNPLLKRITDPNGCMANVTEMTPRSTLSILWGLLLKWGLSCVMYVAYVADILNKDAFSYARMVFTDASWLWFRIVVICIAAELLALIPAKLICRGNRKAGAGKIMTVMLEADFSPLLFMAGGALMFVNTAAGAAVTAVAAGYELLVRVKALEIATECRKVPALIASLLFFCVLALLGYAGLKYFGGDLIKIYSVISGK